MRVADRAHRAASGSRRAAGERFAAALRDARRRAQPGARDDARLDAVAAAKGLRRRTIADLRDAALVARRERSAEEPPPASAPARVLAPASGAGPPQPSAELRALVRALPPAVEAARVREGAPLALAFGGALSVELTVAPAGVEVLLKPGAELARVVRAELPLLVDALRARGVVVARAEVLPRAHGAPPGAGRPR
jgi:hypothetical protein